MGGRPYFTFSLRFPQRGSKGCPLLCQLEVSLALIIDSLDFTREGQLANNRRHSLVREVSQFRHSLHQVSDSILVAISQHSQDGSLVPSISVWVGVGLRSADAFFS